jgi:hypothetical protein
MPYQQLVYLLPLALRIAAPTYHSRHQPDIELFDIQHHHHRPLSLDAYLTHHAKPQAYI